MRIGVCPGSFDPVSNGHLDIFLRSSKMFDLVIAAVFHNPNKKPLFTMEERVDMLTLATQGIPNIKVDSFSGLLNDYVRRQNSTFIVRGLRALSDFEYEFQRALLIKKIDPDMETIFMMTSSDYSFISSSGIKELARFGGPITGLVPACLEEKIVKRIREKS
ncbi:pantetheine-phosphate adenylyltransferase [Sporomusa sphaeroides]|uniref:Phosphopantetheine adenylyltransferase n=2 Tax=Sporomusa TaxID=2375 RepID=A0ABP2C254_9FIRM|nr:pantetheine-phosphate adenylyltransferase [Sporomusa sphaeroides]OLS58097.1 phosphopantetheine adenylyltransferase [Sporomusa sphaeroides DSM 2875]CVK17716.1 Phosphopantetheine adenylyltransferase [Sporomusa sphaeroides DSM 2875]SCM80524.1 Phosphopantetheine adenylyltransferase [uncultured Sporomusa sp.]HML31430.1 pantetheine-phosphate adenylyltransferase [Sporomusa sphaeroides]